MLTGLGSRYRVYGASCTLNLSPQYRGGAQDDARRQHGAARQLRGAALAVGSNPRPYIITLRVAHRTTRGDSMGLRASCAAPPSLPALYAEWIIRSASAAALSAPGHDARSACAKAAQV